MSAVYPKWHDPVGGWLCTVYFACGPGPYGRDAGAPPVPVTELWATLDVGAAGCLALVSEEVLAEQPATVTVSSSDTAGTTAARIPMADPRHDGDTVRLPRDPELPRGNSVLLARCKDPARAALVRREDHAVIVMHVAAGLSGTRRNGRTGFLPLGLHW
ncbi:hypothetical protein GCM10010331_70390 [Streptomyces xanthochromogenes]|nr:hypothetical protein GCM10010331_70390 [Streptomyces xanthochromogenes]